MSELSPGQTIGPFFHHALPFAQDCELVPLGSPGSLVLHGTVYDGAGQPVPDALIEIRQTDATGAVPVLEGSFNRRGRPFTGWGRAGTDRTGRYWFSTLEPARFFAVVVFARGLLDRLFTRIYLPGATDAFLDSVPERSRMIATREDDGSLRFDIHLQGEHESVFLTYPGHRS